MTFAELHLLPSLIESLAEQNITEPTEIQSRTLRRLLDGRSVVGVSETGSGKTLAYALPVLQRLKAIDTPELAVTKPAHPRGLVLVPGRELGEQVSKVFKSLTHGTRLRVRTVLGGTKKQVARQNVSMKFEVLVATPGRMLDLLDAGQLHLDDVRMVVFDEADQMLDPGFLPVAQRIVGDCPDEVQIVMFSATLPASLQQVIRELFPTPPKKVQTKGSHHLVPTLTVDNRDVVDGQRGDVLRKVLAEEPAVGTLLFANTRRQCERIAEFLDREGIAYVRYMGEMERTVRRANLAAFRKGEVDLLISTDLGGRGLDIDRVERVINAHLPRQVDNYLHRVGRTARAGRPGRVVNLVTPRDAPLMQKIERIKASAIGD